MPSSERRAVLMLITVVVAWGSTWPVNKVILASVPPLWSVTFRTAIATVALLAVVAAAGRLAVPPRGDVPVLLGIALLHMVGFTVLSTWGLQMVPTGRSVVLAYTTPLWVTPGARLFLGEPITARRAVGVGVGLLGLAVLFNPLTFDWTDRAVVLGNVAILAAAVLWAASILQIRAHRWRSTPLALAPWETLCAGLVLLPLACTVSPWPSIAWTPTLVAMLLFVGIPGTAIAYWAVAMASRDLPAVTTSLGLLGTPVVSVVTATLWLGEPLTWPLVAAVVLVLSGVAIGATRGEPSRRRGERIWKCSGNDRRP